MYVCIYTYYYTLYIYIYIYIYIFVYVMCVCVCVVHLFIYIFQILIYNNIINPRAYTYLFFQISIFDRCNNNFFKNIRGDSFFDLASLRYIIATSRQSCVQLASRPVVETDALFNKFSLHRQILLFAKYPAAGRLVASGVRRGGEGGGFTLRRNSARSVDDRCETMTRVEPSNRANYALGINRGGVAFAVHAQPTLSPVIKLVRRKAARVCTRKGMGYSAD